MVVWRLFVGDVGVDGFLDDGWVIVFSVCRLVEVASRGVRRCSGLVDD